MSHNLLSRPGRFSMPSRYVREMPDAVAEMLSRAEFVPTRVVHNYKSDDLEYEGYAGAFDEAFTANDYRVEEIRDPLPAPVQYEAGIHVAPAVFRYRMRLLLVKK